jgi:hypothetical protein
MIERSGDDVCCQHHARGDEELMFLDLASKPKSMISHDLASKPLATVLVVCLKTTRSGFPVWASKLAATVW